MMMSSSTFRLPNYSYSFLPTNQTGGQPTPEIEPESQVRKLKGSVQLNRWSRARSIRSGQKLDRPITQTKKAPGPSSSVPAGESTPPLSAVDLGSDSSDGEDDSKMTAAKSIFMVSDGTGSTAENSVNAALGQFEHCLVDRGCPVNTHLYSGIENVDGLMEIVKKAAKEGALLIYTLADPSMADAARQACELWGIPSTDILGPITEAIASHLSVSPSGLSRWARGRKFPLTDEYFRRIEAIEFTMKQDDGALPRNLHKADIVLAGVSRTGKTPLSIYLAQKGYKVANVPIVMGVELPEALFDVDPEKVFGLTVNPLVLHSIRRTRAKSLDFGKEVRNNYSEIDHVKQELEFARNIFAENPVWPVIEVTGRAIEETASIVLKFYHDRKDMCSMAGISKRY